MPYRAAAGGCNRESKGVINIFRLQSALQNCPFCGSDDVGVIEAKMDNEQETHTFSVCCMKCNTSIFRPNFGANEIVAYLSAEEAVKAWNKRSERSNT